MSARGSAGYQNSQRLSREAKRRRRGVCERCGAETRYNGHGVVVSRLCLACANAESGRRQRGTGPLQQRLYALLSLTGELSYATIRDVLGISDGHAAMLMTREVAGGRVVRVRRGVYRLADRELS